MRAPKLFRSCLQRGGKYLSQYAESANLWISSRGMPKASMIWNWYFSLTAFEAALPLLEVNFVMSSFVCAWVGAGGRAVFPLPFSSSSSYRSKFWPNMRTSSVNLSAQALIGIPVQWKPNGKRARFPCILAKPAENSTLLAVKLWPACKVPFIYGYAKLPWKVGYFFRSSEADMDPVGTSDVVGALAWKTPDSCHLAWYFFSIEINISRFSVCFFWPIMSFIIFTTALKRKTHVFQLQSILGAAVRI